MHGMKNLKSTISVGERLQTYTLDRAATGTGSSVHYRFYIAILAETGAFFELHYAHCLQYTDFYI